MTGPLWVNGGWKPLWDLKTSTYLALKAQTFGWNPTHAYLDISSFEHTEMHFQVKWCTVNAYFILFNGKMLNPATAAKALLMIHCIALKQQDVLLLSLNLHVKI